MPEDEGQLIVTTSFADAANAFDAHGRLIRTPPCSKFEIQSYVEFGVAEWLTVIGEAGGMDFHASAGQASLAAPQNPQYSGLGLGALGGRIPIVKFQGYMKDRWQAHVRLQMFHSIELFDLIGFFDSQFGYRTRSQNGDEAHIDLTAGLRPGSNLMLMAQSFTTVSLWRNGANNVFSQKFELIAVYDLNQTFSIQLGLIDAPIGVNFPAERGIVSALWARF